MNQVSIDLENSPEVADLIADKNAGDKIENLLTVTIAEKDKKRLVADIDEVLEVDGETLAAEDEEEAEDDEPSKSVTRIGKGAKSDDDKDEA